MSAVGRRWFAVTVASLVALLAGGLLAASSFQQARSSRAQVCQHLVDARIANRSIWIWVVGQFPGDDTAEAIRRQIELVLPTLTCIDDVPTPKEPAP